MQRKLVVGIDIDDTLTDHYTQCVLDGREFVTKYLHREPDKFDANQMHTKDIYGLTEEEDIKYGWRYWKKQIETASPALYATEVMPELFNDYEIHIITARGKIWKTENPYLSPEEEKNMTIDWLEKHHIPYHHIHFCITDKGKFCQDHGIDVLVDNDPKYIQTCWGLKVIPIIPLKPYTIKPGEFDEKRTLLMRDFQDLKVLLRKIEEYFDKQESKEAELSVTTEAYELVESEFEDEKPVINNKTWFVSDLHLGKPNAGCGEDYYKTINRRVKDNDTLIICGDIGFRKDENRLQKLSDFFRKVNCKHMFLVLGNHDIDDVKLYRAMGFKGVYRKIVTPKYLITHEPVAVKGDVINIHGHIHMERVYANNVDWHNHINCFWRLCGGPRRLEDLLVMMKNGKFEGRTIDDEKKTKIPDGETIKVESTISEGALDADERNALGDNAFGLPRQRKYPLHDKEHVMDAIRKFNYCERQYEAELAHNITRAMKKYKISTSVIGDRNRLLSYLDI